MRMERQKEEFLVMFTGHLSQVHCNGKQLGLKWSLDPVSSFDY